MVRNPSNRIKTEVIDEVILGLLGLKPGVEIYYQTYFEILKKKLSTSRLAGKELPEQEDDLLRQELKRIWKIKDKAVSFKIKKVKVKTSSVSPGIGPGSASSGGRRPPKSGAIVRAPKGKIVPYTFNIQTDKKDSEDSFVGIRKTLNSILGILSSKFKFEQKQADVERKDKETEKRGKAESGLEEFKKGIGAIVSTTKKLFSPFQAIIDRIWRFIFFTLLGKGFTKFMEWMSDKENRKKFDSFIEFLTDHWPALAGLYVLFGTSFGKLVRGLLKGVVRMTVAIAMNIPKLIKFVKNKPRLAGLFTSVAALGSGYLSREVQGLFADKETPESGLIPKTNQELDDAKKLTNQAQNTPTPKIPGANLGGLIPSFKLGAINPFGGMNFQQGIPITGAGKDDTLIAAKTGEAILTEKDQQDIGQRYVDRNTGEPLNIPQYLAGRKPGRVSMDNIKPRFGGGFNFGGIIPRFNAGGMVGGVPVRAENPKMSSSRPALDALNITTNPLKYSIQEAQDRLLEKQRERNTNIKHNRFRPWWERLNPFAEKRPYGLRLPSHSPESRTYNMPGYDKNKWLELDRFRNDPNPETYRSNPSNPKNRFSPSYQKPGVNKPLLLRGGGLIKENTGLNLRGATNDRQAIFAQPGEYMLPVDTVSRLGGPLVLDRLVAMTDSNSTPFKQGALSRPNITPYKNSGVGGMITLPPITQMSGGTKGRASGYAGGSRAPLFPTIPTINDRDANAFIYGINNIG